MFWIYVFIMIDSPLYITSESWNLMYNTEAHCFEHYDETIFECDSGLEVDCPGGSLSFAIAVEFSLFVVFMCTHWRIIYF